MWKIISVFTLLTIVHAANIQDIYTDWWQVAYYPVDPYAHMCIRLRFAGSSEVKCTNADGRNGTLVQATAMTEKGELMGNQWMPMTVVNTAAEVRAALNANFTCDGREMREHGVVRVVNEDYFILYTPITGQTRTELEQNTALLFGKHVVSSDKLTAVMLSIEELKDRQGAQLCVTENYGGFNTTGNEDRDRRPFRRN